MCERRILLEELSFSSIAGPPSLREVAGIVPRDRPRRRIDVRFEDFVLKQDETLSHLSKYFEFPMAKIEARPDSVGRWKTRADVDFSRFDDLFRKELVEQGYVSKVKIKK